MTQNEIAYLAGIVDGEGTISLSTGTGKPEHSRPFVQIANTNYKLAAWIREKVEIKFGFFEYDRHPEKQKASFLFMWRGTYGVEFLKLILPYLILKREQALLVLDLWEGEAKWNTNKRGKWCAQNPMPDIVFQKRVEIFQRIRQLNKKGPVSLQEK
jgi:hypothetical protein